MTRSTYQMRIDDHKHNGWLEVKVEQGYFKMDAQVRLYSLMEMYLLGFVLLGIKILVWRRIGKWVKCFFSFHGYDEYGICHKCALWWGNRGFQTPPKSLLKRLKIK